MDKKTLGIGGVIVIGIAAIVGWGIWSGHKANAPIQPVTGTVYFWGAECPHCKKVNDYIEANGIADKVSYEKKEVWHDQENAKQMSQAATQCGMSQDQVGVPFVFDNGTCHVGEVDVMKFFGDRAGVTATQ